MKKAYKSIFGQDEKGNLIFERYDIIRDKYRHIKLDYHKIRKIIINLMEGYDMTDILDMYKDDTIEDNCRVVQEKNIFRSFENNNDYLYMFQTILKSTFDDDEHNNKKLIELCKISDKKLIEFYNFIIENKECFNKKQEFIDYSKIKTESNEDFQLLSNFLNEYKNDFSDFCYNNNVDITWINLNHFYISPCDVPRILFDNFYKIIEGDNYKVVSNILFEFILTYYAGEFHSRKMLDSILKNIGKNPCAINTFVDLISRENGNDTELNYLYSFEEEFGENPIEILIEILENFDKSFDIDSLFGNYVYCYANLNAFNANIVGAFEIYKNERRI